MWVVVNFKVTIKYKANMNVYLALVVEEIQLLWQRVQTIKEGYIKGIA
jgi:hypothetical protein